MNNTIIIINLKNILYLLTQTIVYQHKVVDYIKFNLRTLAEID